MLCSGSQKTARDLALSLRCAVCMKLVPELLLVRRQAFSDLSKVSYEPGVSLV